MGQAYTESLNRKHAMLEHEIDTESHRPHPDEARLSQLKRRKLKLKDEMRAGT